MRWQDSSYWVWKSTRAYPMKSFLTALGIAIGIAAMSILTAVGEGVKFYVLENFSQFGTRIIAINPGKTQIGGIGGLLSTTRPLTLDDALSLDRLPHVTRMVPLVQGTGEIEFKQRKRSSDILGVNNQMAVAWKFDVASGRFLPDEATAVSRAYAVLGHKMKQELFGSMNPLGAIIRVGGVRFRVIGVLEEKGQMLGFDMDDIVYIPVDRALTMFNREGLMEIDIVYDESISSEKMGKMVKQHLIERHGYEDFTIITQDEMLDTLDKILSVLTYGIAALGAISLLVGGVGIMTIMTTTVRERTQEIGLLSALGTTSGQILKLFLFEAVFLALLGALIGLSITLFLILAVQLSQPGFPIAVNGLYFLLALFTAFLVGMAAGYIPARNAASLQPIEALHAE